MNNLIDVKAISAAARSDASTNCLLSTKYFNIDLSQALSTYYQTTKP